MGRFGSGAWLIGTVQYVQGSSNYGVFDAIPYFLLGRATVSVVDKSLSCGNVDVVPM